MYFNVKCRCDIKCSVSSHFLTYHSIANPLMKRLNATCEPKNNGIDLTVLCESLVYGFVDDIDMRIVINKLENLFVNDVLMLSF